VLAGENGDVDGDEEKRGEAGSTQRPKSETAEFTHNKCAKSGK